MLRYLTAGESHGKTLLALVDGFPAGVTIDTDPIDVELKRRQGGYGRGGRQRIESDKVEVRTGKGTAVATIPPETRAGTRLRLRGQGLTSPGGGRGDLYIILRIALPDLSDRQRELLLEAEGAGSANVTGGARTGGGT